MAKARIERFGGIAPRPPVLYQRLVLLFDHLSVTETLLDTTQR